MPDHRPRLLITGPMLGSHPGQVTTAGEILAQALTRRGFPVRTTSSVVQPLGRAADTLACLWRWRRTTDVVITSVFSGRAFRIADTTTALAERLGLPVVLVLHGGALPDFARGHGEALRRLGRRAAAVVAPSEYLRVELADLMPDTQVIPNVLDLSQYEYRERRELRPRILWMRTFHEIYQPSLALDVLEQVRDSYPDVTLTMAGQDKGLLAPTRADAVHRGLGEAVHFAGFLDPQAKRREFAAHDVFLNTTLVDNAPVSIVEAAASGLPVVATAVGGVPYLLEDGTTGLLTGAQDVAGLAGNVLRLLEDPDVAGRLSRQGRRLAESWSEPAVVAAWEALLQDLIRLTSRQEPR